MSSKKLLLATDCSQACTEALIVASALARDSASRLIIAHVSESEHRLLFGEPGSVSVVKPADAILMLAREEMTKSVIVCRLDDPTDKVRSIMKTRYVRQLPVVDDEGKVIGIVSLGDVSAHLIVEEAAEIHHMHDYIQGRVR